MKLVDKDGKELKVGDKVKTFRDENCVITHIHPPSHLASSGHVSIRILGGDPRYVFVSVVGAKFVED